MGLADPGASRTGPDTGRRGHHRPARPGVRQRGGHGHRGAASRRRVQPPGLLDHRSLDVRARLRRRPPGGCPVRGGQPRRPPAPRQAARALRRQPHPARRADGHGLVRGRPAPLRGIWLGGRPGRGRQRPRRDRGGDPGRARRREAFAPRRPHPHRLRRAAQAGHAESPRLAARRGRGPPRQGGVWLGPRRPLPRPRAGPPVHGRGRRRGKRARPRLGAAVRRVPGRIPGRCG